MLGRAGAAFKELEGEEEMPDMGWKQDALVSQGSAPVLSPKRWRLAALLGAAGFSEMRQNGSWRPFPSPWSVDLGFCLRAEVLSISPSPLHSGQEAKRNRVGDTESKFI